MNYGNILQRCALSRVIENLGFEVWHLCEIPEHSAKALAKKLIKQTIKYILALTGVKRFRRQFKFAALLNRIKPAFTKFQDRYVTRKIFMTQSQALKADKSQWAVYDYAVTGSDQVWNNWSHTCEQMQYYYLLFMPREKRVCYAPSFGFSEFPVQDYEMHKNGLEGFERISCREPEMIPMIKCASGKNAQLVLDPTLLLTAEDWRNYEAKPDYDVPEKYILCYFLGSKIPEYFHAISEAAGNLPVINIYDTEDTKYSLTDPGNFIWLIDHADFVCTDSFHGTAFSINFGKEFLAFRRRQKNMEDMFGRISGLLDSLNITGHIYGEGIRARPEAVNYEKVYPKLNALRESSMNFLRECLK